MTYSQQDGSPDRTPERAAIFVDYEDLFRTLSHSIEIGDDPARLIAEMIEALQRSLFEDREAQTAAARAYADFASLPGDAEHIQRSLYLQGTEPHFVPRPGNEDAVELQLCVDAMDVLHHRADVTTFVLLTGRRIYLPLLRMFRRYGRRVLVAGLDEPGVLDGVPTLEGNWYFPARDLLSASSRQRAEASEATQESHSSDRLGEIDDPALFRTLEIIEEHFGQYEEVYLTPLLRKLSKLLDERRHDPKILISDLEECGAARLEKRKGFPHDYTVLILEKHHPTVARVQSVMRSSYYYEDAREDREAGVRTDGDGSYRRNGSGEYDGGERFEASSAGGEDLDGEAYDDGSVADEVAGLDRIHDAPPPRDAGGRTTH